MALFFSNGRIAKLAIQSGQPELIGVARRRCILLRLARPAAWLGFAALAGGLLYGVIETAVAQGLGLVQGQSDVGQGFIAQHLIEQIKGPGSD